MRTYEIELTKKELDSLLGMLDAAVRAVGLRAIKEVAPLLEKIEVIVRIKDAENEGRSGADDGFSVESELSKGERL